MVNSNFDKDYVDVDFEDVIEKQINGEVLYYSTTQVAGILGLSDSKVRYYAKVFEDLLNLEFSNKSRRFKKGDIEKLKFILELADEGLTLAQIKEYCSEKNMEDIKKEMIVKDNPLQIQVFMKALTEEMDKIIESRLADHLNQIKVQQEEINNKLTETIAVTVDELVSEKLETKLDEFKAYIDTQEQQAKQRDLELLDSLKTSLEDQKKLLEQNHQPKQSFFSKIFKR